MTCLPPSNCVHSGPSISRCSTSFGADVAEIVSLEPPHAASARTTTRTARRIAPELTRVLRHACSRLTKTSHRPSVRQATAAALGALALLLPSPASAAPGLLLGIDDDSLKWYSKTSSLLSIYDTLGVDAVR